MTKALERATRRQHHKPITLEQWDRLLALHKQIKAWINKPDTAPHPDAHLMIGTEHGPIGAVSIERFDEEEWVCFALRNSKLPGFPLRLEVALTVSLLLAFGGSLFANPNNKGRTYLSLFSGNDTVPLARIVSNARAKEVIKQRVTDAPGYDPESLVAVPVDYVRFDEKLPMRVPGRGRSHAIAVALAGYHRRHRAIGIELSARRYQTLLREACAFIETRARYRYLARQDAWFDQFHREFARAIRTHRTPEDEAAFNEFTAAITGQPYPQDNAQ